MVSLQHRSLRHSHLPHPPAHRSPSLSLRPRHQPLLLVHVLHTPHLCRQYTERSHPKHRRYLPRRHRRSPLPLLRLHKQRHLVLQLRLLRHPSPPKGKPPRSRSLQLVVKPRRRPTASKRKHPHILTPASSTPLDAKGGGKRARDDDTDAPTPGVTSAPSPKRVKPDWEGPPNEEVRKRDEQAENVKTDDQAMKLFEHVTKFIDENPESAEAA